MESLDWCGIKVDEGVREGGNFGPYRQSEKKSIYPEYAQKLVDSGYAYYAFDTSEELEARRKEYEARKEAFIYDASIRSGMKNSLLLPEEEIQRRLNSGDPYVIRFKIPENIEVSINDLIRGEVVVNTSTLDDKVLFKSDGMPTYHLANVVDDYLMKISHVIRGEEWLPSLPLHVLLYRAFGWENKMPEFAHMPLTLRPDGKGKLSKRDGDRLGFPVFPLEWTNSDTGEVSRGYREDGYFPEAFINIIAFLGWNPGTTQEIFSMDELIRAFSIDKVIKAGSRFDQEKAKWYNQQYLRAKSDRELAMLFQPILRKKGIEADDQFVEKVCDLVKERATFVHELWDHARLFFQAPEKYDQKVVKKSWKEQIPGIMKELYEVLSDITNFTSVNTEKVVRKWIEEKDYGVGQVMNAFRLCIVGAAIGPHLFDIIELIGKTETLARIETGLKNITMKVICDTNIWYYVGDGTINPDDIKDKNKLIATYNNIDELSRTFNLIDNSDHVRNSIQAIFKYMSDVIYEQPLIYLKKLANPDFKYDIKKNLGQILEFTQLIANGHDLDKSKKEDYRKYCQQRYENLQEAAGFFNKEADKIRKKITDKKKHKEEDTIPLNRNLISFFVSTQTNDNGLPNDFDWNKIELFEHTLKYYFLELETTDMKVQPNDWYDIFQLIYVQPGNKIWTREKRWKNLIIKAGMEKYLYEK